MTNHNHSNKIVAQNTFLLTIRMILVTAITIFTTRFLLQNLGVEDYGVYNVTLGIVSICAFLRPSMAYAIQRFYNYELGRNELTNAQRIFNAGICIQVVITSFIVLLCETIGIWYLYNKLVVPEGRFNAVFWVFQIAVFSVCLTMMQVPFTAVVMAREKMNFYAVLNIIDAVLKFVIAIIIKYSPYDKLVFYAFLLCFITFLDVIINAIYAIKYFPEARFSCKGLAPWVKPILSFSFWNLFESFARIGKDQGGNMLLNYYFGPIINAARGVTMQVSYALSSLVDSTGTASRPQIVQRYAQGDIDSSKRIFMSISKFVVLLIIMFGLPIFLDVDYILKLWLGHNVPQYACVFIRIILLYLLTDKIAMPITAIIHATGKIKYYHILSSIFNIASIPIVWFAFSVGCSPSYLYISFFTMSLLALMAFLILLNRQINLSVMSYLKETILKPTLCLLISSILPIVIFNTIPQSFYRLALIAVSSLLCVSICAYLICLSNNERNIIKNMVRKVGLIQPRI